jgi:hypothetical protein
MIRFRFGQSWKRERALSPTDSIGLDLDGVDLLAGASEELLPKVVPDLVDAICALWLKGAPLAQVSLPEAHLELLLRRVDTEVELSVVSLARPARLTRPPLRLDLFEVAEAARRSAHGLLEDFAEVAPELLRTGRNLQLAHQLQLLERATEPAPLEGHAETGFSYRRAAGDGSSFSFELIDTSDLLLAYARTPSAALGSLLCTGRVCLTRDRVPVWTAEGAPYLIALELARQALDLEHAVELSEAQVSFPAAGPGNTGVPAWSAHLLDGVLRVGGQSHPFEPQALARALLEVGVALVFAIKARSPAQARNPYVAELLARCQQGLSQLQSPEPPSEGDGARASRKRPTSERPIPAAGRLRRLGFRPLWEKQSLGGEEPGRLLLGAKGPVYSSTEMACAFSRKGEMLLRRVATHGVAASADGRTLAASAEQVMFFSGGERSARWVRDHDGMAIGPELFTRDGLLLTVSEGRTALAYCEITGREIWRLSPPRTQRSFLAVQGHRALLTTDSGFFCGLDVATGQVRFRMRALLPFLGPAVAWGRKALGVVGRGDRTALFATDAHSGSMVWTRELPLALPSNALPSGKRVFIAGEHEQVATLTCLDQRGEELFSRKLPLGQGPFSLVSMGKSVLVVSQSGAATRVTEDGTVEWVAGSAGERLSRLIAPHVARGVAVLPGETVRAVDASGGELLAEVRAGAGLCDLKADGRLNLYLLDEDGVLSAHQLATHLAVVKGGESGE